MTLSKDERSIVVERELEKAQKTFADMEFCAKENGKRQPTDCTMHFSTLFRHC